MSTWRRWKKLWAEIGATGDARAFYDDLETRYREAGRSYHTLRHVGSCLAELYRVRALCARPRAVELALWYHDAVYDPRASDNEARSAALLREEASRMGIDPGLSRAAGALVMATAHFAEDTGGELSEGVPADAAVMQDIDLAILGTSRRRFDAYESAVRQEYAFLSAGEWAAGRTRVLQSFLGRARIFATAALREKYEKRARVNLARSLARLHTRQEVC